MNGKKQNHFTSLVTYYNLSLKIGKIKPYLDDEALYS
jgi:hypothetical protein